MKILKETENAVQVLDGEIEVVKYDNVREEDYKFFKKNYIWIPKSLCKIENDEVVEVEHWFAKKNMLTEFLTVEVRNGRKFYV